MDKPTKQWGGKRIAGAGKHLGRKPVPPEMKLIRRQVFLYQHQIAKLQRLNSNLSKAIRQLVDEKDKPQ